MNNKKAQMSLADAPTIVLIVGLTFLVLATIAFIGEKYQDSFTKSQTGTVNNESVTSMSEAGKYVAQISQCNFDSFTVKHALNANSSDSVIPATNYTTTADGKIKFTAGTAYNTTTWKVSYTFVYSGQACNATRALQTTISDNTSIAGIVLTISLVGIVLTVLIGVFLGIRGRRV